jgi:hypothetical protein
MKLLVRRLTTLLIERLHLVRFAFSDGSYLDVCDRRSLLYTDTDGVHQMEVTWTVEHGRFNGRVLNRASVNRWLSPHQDERVALAKKLEIRNKISEYCRARHTSLRID